MNPRDELVRADPKSAKIIKPYFRGQDIERWYLPWDGLWMIFARRGIDIDAYPAIKHHLEGFKRQLKPKPEDWVLKSPKDEWPGRKSGSYAWYEIQDYIEYWQEFSKPKIFYQVIQFHPRFTLDDEQRRSAADIQRLKQEHADTVQHARDAAR